MSVARLLEQIQVQLCEQSQVFQFDGHATTCAVEEERSLGLTMVQLCEQRQALQFDECAAQCAVEEERSLGLTMVQLCEQSHDDWCIAGRG